MWDFGGTIPLQITTYNAAGVAQNATAVTLTVTLPDATTTSPAVTAAGSGVYTATGPATQAGRYTLVWAATGTNSDQITDTYDVRPAASTAILSLADGKAALNSTKAINDRELRDYIDAVTDLIEGEIGAVLPRAVSETVEIWRDFFVPRQPIISLTSLTPVRTGGMTLNVADYQVLSTGKVIRKDGAWVSVSPWNQYVAVYQAGRASVNPRIFEAARVLLQHLWANQRPNTGNPRSGDDYTPDFTMPNSVREALASLNTTGIG